MYFDNEGWRSHTQHQHKFPWWQHLWWQPPESIHQTGLPTFWIYAQWVSETKLSPEPWSSRLRICGRHSSCPSPPTRWLSCSCQPECKSLNGERSEKITFQKVSPPLRPGWQFLGLEIGTRYCPHRVEDPGLALIRPRPKIGGKMLLIYPL